MIISLYCQDDTFIRDWTEKKEQNNLFEVANGRLLT